MKANPDAPANLRKAQQVNVKINGPAIGSAPHHVRYSVDLPREKLDGADILWMDNGVWMGDYPSGSRIIDSPGLHYITVLVVTKDTTEYRGQAKVQVLERVSTAANVGTRLRDTPNTQRHPSASARPTSQKNPQDGIGTPPNNDCDWASLARLVKKQRRSIAIIDFEVSQSMCPNTAEAGRALGDICRAQVQKSKAFALIDRENMKEVLGEQDFAAAMRCDNTKCLVEYGKLLNAQKLLHGRLSQLDVSTYVLYVGITDVNTGVASAGSSDFVRDMNEARAVVLQLTCVAIRG